MSDIDWSEAPEGTTHCLPGTIHLHLTWLKKVDGERVGHMGGNDTWDSNIALIIDKIIERPQPSEPDIISVDDMKEGMVVRCVKAESSWYSEGYKYTVGDDGDLFGPLDEVDEVSPELQDYKFTLVSEPLKPSQPRKTVEDAVEHQGEKWTHECCGEKCVIIAEADGNLWVKGPNINALAEEEDVKPIPTKPTITKAEKEGAYKLARFLNISPYEVQDFLCEYRSEPDPDEPGCNF